MSLLRPGVIKQHKPQTQTLTSSSFVPHFISSLQMVSNYVNLKRMFLCLDKNLDGTVAIEDLLSVLNHFTFAMSNQLFHQLMERYDGEMFNENFMV